MQLANPSVNLVTRSALRLRRRRVLMLLANPSVNLVTRSALSRIRGSWREALLALGLAVGLWYVAIPGGALETVDRRVPIVVENLPEGYRLVSVSPSDVAVRFEGRRRDLYLASATDLAVEVDALLVQLGRRTFSLSLDQVRSPEEVRPVSIEPARIKLSVMQD